jgi:hypothetical protein
MELTYKDLRSEEGCHPLSNFELQTEMGIYVMLRLLFVLEFSDLRLFEQLVQEEGEIYLLLH